LAPAGTPEPIVRRLNTEVLKALALPPVREALANQNFEIMGGSPEEFAAFVRAEIEKWTGVVDPLR